MSSKEYTAKKSAWAGVTFLTVILFWLVIPLIIIICRIISAKNETITFYEDKIIVKKGVFSKSEKKFAFNGVIGVSVNQTMWGRMFNYGDVTIDVPGTWSVDTTYISKPKQLEDYLETRLIKSNQQTVLAN